MFTTRRRKRATGERILPQCDNSPIGENWKKKKKSEIRKAVIPDPVAEKISQTGKIALLREVP